MSLQRTQRFICGRQSLLPDGLVRTVLDLARADDQYAYTREDVFATLVCAIEAHESPVHYGAALNLRGPEAGTLWALWGDGPPNAVIEIPDCTVGMHEDACSEFLGHPGGHSWELADPPGGAGAPSV
ncbi:hypothetical protein [Streptomyces sp. NBC_01190]|uniref:hypothetical protein n=1 Tax=Streptomyces sp. NBC_01190 TaxID=2903767 RepID=UPI003870EA59|nr:hypothetical protein OG519_16025 [Streptomyces sp. NBC_01190]